MAGSARRCADRCRQVVRVLPDRRPVAAGGVPARHGVAVTVSGSALARGSCVDGGKCSRLGCQDAPDKGGGTVHMGSAGKRHCAVAVRAGNV